MFEKAIDDVKCTLEHYGIHEPFMIAGGSVFSEIHVNLAMSEAKDKYPEYFI